MSSKPIIYPGIRNARQQVPGSSPPASNTRCPASGFWHAVTSVHRPANFKHQTSNSPSAIPNNFKLCCLFLMLLLAGSTTAQPSGSNSNFRLRGYMKAMPGLHLDQDFGDPAFHNSLHNRLNFRWDITSDVDLRIEGRNRLLYHQLYDEIPGIEDVFAQDKALLDLSWLWLSDGGWIGHSEVDRLYLTWRRSSWRVRAGRQRINWGINLVSNPNDLFNTYSFFDFDYPERPGTDAVRVQHYISRLSSIEVAVSPARDNRDMVTAAKYAHNLRGYDIQFLGGYFRDRVALGGGWAGHIGGAGFKGEISWFYDINEQQDVDRSNVVAAVGLDYMFANGTFTVAELLYNGGHNRTGEDAFLITEPMRADDIMFSEYAITLNADHSFSPILRGGLAVMVLPDIEAVFMMPQLNYSVKRDLDFEFVAQIFTGGDNTILEEAGHGFFGSLRYSF